VEEELLAIVVEHVEPVTLGPAIDRTAIRAEEEILCNGPRISIGPVVLHVAWAPREAVTPALGQLGEVGDLGRDVDRGLCALKALRAVRDSDRNR